MSLRVGFFPQNNSLWVLRHRGILERSVGDVEWVNLPKIPGVNHLRAVRAFEKAGFKIVRQGKHTVMSDGSHFITIPRHNPVNALTMGGIVKDAGINTGPIVNWH